MIGEQFVNFMTHKLLFQLTDNAIH